MVHYPFMKNLIFRIFRKGSLRRLTISKEKSQDECSSIISQSVCLLALHLPTTLLNCTEPCWNSLRSDNWAGRRRHVAGNVQSPWICLQPHTLVSSALPVETHVPLPSAVLLPQVDTTAMLHLLRLSYTQKTLLYLRRLLHQQESQQGLELGGTGENPLASLRTRFA